MGKRAISILLIVSIIIVLNLISRNLHLRFDTTDDNQYTLSNATKDILKNLQDPITVTAWFSDNLHPSLEKGKNDFREMLEEYSVLSDGLVNYEFITPKTDEQRQEAGTNGIQPIMVSTREKDQNKQQRVYMGAVIKSGSQPAEIIPIIQSGANMEYDLSTKMKKLAVIDKPPVALISGHGEAEPSQLGQVYNSMSIQYNVEPLDITKVDVIPERFKTIAMIDPKDSISLREFQMLDDFLNNGGNMVIALNAVTANLQTSQGTPQKTGVAGWLKAKGLEVESAFVVDARCGQVTVQQQVGPFRLPTQVPFPYLPLTTNFADHPITNGLEMVMFQFVSPIRYIGTEAFSWTPIVMSSNKSGIEPAPVTFDVQNKNLNNYDFSMNGVVLGGILEGKLPNVEQTSRIVVIGDGDFALTNGEQRQSEDNISLLVNSIDWLSDDTGLVELRTKGVSTRPLEQLEDGRRSFLKFVNIGLPILLIVIFGFFRTSRSRAKRQRRLKETF